MNGEVADGDRDRDIDRMRVNWPKPCPSRMKTEQICYTRVDNGVWCVHRFENR